MTTDHVTDADPPRGEGNVEARVGRLEAEQQRQGGILEQILATVRGGGGPAPGSGPAAGPAPGGPPDAAAIAAQVREEIAEADRRRAAEQKDTKWRDDVSTTLERLRRERAPREPETGLRAAVQRLVIGRQP